MKTHLRKYFYYWKDSHSWLIWNDYNSSCASVSSSGEVAAYPYLVGRGRWSVATDSGWKRVSDIEVNQALCDLTWARPEDSFAAVCAKVHVPDRRTDSGTVIDKNSKVYEFRRFWHDLQREELRNVFPVVLGLEWAEQTSLVTQADVSLD